MVRLSVVWAMLDGCAPGYVRVQKLHHWWVTWRGRTFRQLPLGKHGRRSDPEVEVSKVRSMVRHLGISIDCARRFIPEL